MEWNKTLDPAGRPAGNMTGFTIFPATITGKYLSMLKEIVPQLVRVASSTIRIGRQRRAHSF
jgi:hypothetical protein